MANKKKGPEGFNDWYERNGGQAQETQTRQHSNSSGSAKPQAFNDWYNAGANEPYTTLRFLADDMARSSRVRAQSRSAWLQEMQYKQQKQQMDKTNSDIAAYNEFQRRQYNQALGNAFGKMAAAPIKGGKRGNIDPATLASIGGKVAKGAGNKANSTINVVRNNWEVPDGGNQPRSRGTNDAPYAIAPGAPVTDNSEYEARRMALDELIRANRNMNSVTGSYVMDDLLGYQREKSPERTEQKEDTTPQHVQQFSTLSSADIKARQDRYNEMVESDLTLARNLLSATFAGVEPARSMARDELGNKWGINAYDAEELRLLADRLERGVVYTDKDGNETTWDKLYNNALNREKAEASILPPEEQAYVQSLYDMTSDELEKSYGTQDDETKTGDLSTAEWLLNATVPWFEYDENSEVGQARARLNAEYGIDPTNENDLRTLIENLKTYEASDVIYTDSNGKNYTYQDLYYNAENREKFNKLETDSDALDLVAEGLRLQKQIDMFNAYIVDAGTAAEYAPMVTDLGNKKNLIAERLNERGYDLDRMLGYLNTEDAKQRFLMQSQATAKWTEENPVLANIASMLATPVQAVEWMANNTGSGNPEDLKNYVPMNYFGMDATNFSSAVRGTTSNMIQNEMLKAGFSDKFAELASETYSGVLSAAQSRILALACTAMAGPGAGEIISLAIMGSSAASDTLRESIDRGLDNRHAIITAMSAGVAEAAFEELSLDKFLENVLDPANLPKGILDALRKSQLQRLVEGSEEFFTDIANAISDRIINGDMSEYNTNIRAYMQQNGGDRIDAVKKANKDFVTQVLQSAFGGYIGGGGFGSFALNSVVNSTPFQQAMSPFNNAYNRYQQNRAYQNIGASVIENQNTGALVDAAQMSGDELLRGLAEQVAEAQTIQKPSRRQQKVYEISTGKLAAETAKTNFQKATESNESVLRQAIETELKNRGLDATDNDISAVRKALSGEELTYDEKYPSYRINAPEIAEAMKERTPEIEEEASKISQEAFTRVKNVQKMANADFSERVSKTGEVINTETGKAVEIGEFVKDGDNGITLTTKDGGRVSVADLQFADTTQAALYEEVDAAGFSPEVANQVVRGFDGKGTAAVSSYMNGMLEGMAYGRTHQNTDMNFSGPFYADLSASQKDLAIKLGQMERGFDTEKATAKINELKALSGGVQRKGSVTGVTSSSAGLNNAQRTGIRTIEMLVDNGALTNNFHFFSSVDNGKGRVLSEDIGGLKKGVAAPNGFYDPKTGDIYIDVNAGNNGEGTVLFTAAHEVTHFVKQWSPNKFNDLANFLVQEYHGAGISVDGLVREQMRKGSSRHLSYDEAFEEMVADSMQTMFTDGNLAAKLMDLKTRDKTLFDKIMDFVKKLQTGINKVYARYTPDSEEAKALSQIKGAVDRLADTFAEGITAATENYNATDASNLSAKEIKDLKAKGLSVVNGLIVADNLEALAAQVRKPGSLNIYSYRTEPEWEKSVIAQWGDTEETRRYINAVRAFTDAMVSDDAIRRVVPMGSYAYDKYGPLRDNVEYVITFDMDTSCPRTFQFTKYRDHLQAYAKRPLTYNESVNLLELMRVYGQNIPCSYCYVENKRVLLSASYNNFFKLRNDVLNEKDATKAMAKMYGYNTKKKTLADASQKVFDRWRSDMSYNPTIQDVWNATQTARNSVFNFLDSENERGNIDIKKSQKAIEELVCDHFGVKGQTPRAEVSGFVSEWIYDTFAEKEHTYLQKNDPSVSEVDVRALALNHEALVYAKSASSAKTVSSYVPYTDQLKNISPEVKAYVIGMGGIRKHSSNDFRIDYVQDYLMFYADLAAGGWTGHTYTKSPDFVKIFGNTGDRINMSIAMTDGPDGTVRENELEGMYWKVAKELRNAYKNAGVMSMVTSDAQLSYALNADWIDMIIPFHASSLDKHVWYDLRHWFDYTSKQLERFLSSKDMKLALIQKALDDAGVEYSSDGMKQKLIDVAREKGAGALSKDTDKIKQAEISRLVKLAAKNGVQFNNKMSAKEIETAYNTAFGVKTLYNAEGKRIKPHFLPGETVVDGVTIPGHGNDVQKYLDLCREYGVHPRFDGVAVQDKNGNYINVVDHEGYLKLIKETARTDSEQEKIQFNFDKYDDYLKMTPMEYALQQLHDNADIGMYDNMSEDPMGIQKKFIDDYLGKNRDIGWLPEYAEDFKEYREEQQNKENTGDVKDLPGYMDEDRGTTGFKLSSRDLGFGVTVEDIENYVDNAYSKSNKLGYKKYAPVNERLIEDVSDDISDIADYSHALRDNDIRHINNSHGPNTNEKYPVTPEDIKLIPYIVNHYDKVFTKTNAKGQLGLLYVKVFPDNVVYFVEAVTDSYGGEKLLINKQMIKTGIDSIPNVHGYLDAITKKQTESEFLSDLQEVRQAYVRNVSQIQSVENSIEQTSTESQEGVKESARDSDGNALSPDQVEYFKDSKIRDEDGNLLVVYHGTDADFTVFDRTKGRANMDIQGMFFSPWELDAEGYGPNVKAYYLNITNPAPEGLAYKALNLYKGQNNAGVKAREYLEKRGYDGVNNGNEEFIAFNSEQIKKVDNKKPTSNPDVRFSDREYMNLARNPEANRDRLTELVNVAASMAGYDSVKLYHGTDQFGFTNIRPEAGDDGRSFFVTDSLETAKTYSYDRGVRPVSKADADILDDLFESSNGVYQLFANTDGFLHIEGGRNEWDEIPLGKIIDDYNDWHGGEWVTRAKTREIAEFAKNAGYPGVKISHIYDHGGKGEGIVKPASVYVFFNPQEQLKSADLVTYDDNGNVIPLSERFNPVSTDLRYSERDPDSMDTRTVLSNALLDAAQNDVERKYIEDYQSKIQAMNEEQNRLNEIRNDIRNMTFGKAPHTTEHLKSLKEEATRLANRINIYDKQLLRIEAMKPMKAVIARETDKVKQRIRADQAAFMTDYKNRASAREYIARIEHEVKGLRDRLLHPKAKTIIPESFAKPAAEFLAAIDFSTFNADGTRRAGKANATRAELQSRLDALAKSIDNASLEADYGQLDISPDMKTWIDSVKLYLENNFSADDDYVLRKMDAEQLEALYKMVVALRTAVNRAGKMYTNMSSDVSDLAHSTIDYLRPLMNRGKRSALGGRAYQFLGWDYAQPVTVFDRFGEGGKQVFKMLMKGQDQEARNVQTILNFVENAYTKKEINSWREEMHDVTINGRTYKVPTSYIQELYCMMKDADARRHIVEGGGIRFAELTTGKGLGVSRQSFEDTFITQDEVDAMIAMLTPRQKEVADHLQEFMDRVGADWGNKISMTRFGYHAFGQTQNYYPIKTVKRGSEHELQQKRANIYALLNKSFTKERNNEADNAVIIDDIFETFTNHMSEMAIYNAWALPVIDTIKWFNYKEPQDVASRTSEVSVKNAFRVAYGEKGGADQYVNKLLEAINGQRTGGLSEAAAFFNMRFVNRVAVAANIRVAVQQPFSITRAFELISPKYVRPMTPAKLISEYKEMVENSAFGRWKDLGYYDVNISKPLEQEILKNERVVDELTDKSMFLAEKGDQLTWATLWHACKLEAVHNGFSGQNLIEAAAEKFDEIIARTQVVDSVLTKSQWMREGSFWYRMTSAFMSEPMTSYNMLLRRFDQFQRDAAENGAAYAFRKNFNNIAKTSAVFLLTQIVNALATAPIDAMRDDDDYKTFWEKMMENFKESTLENINPANMMPYVNDIVEYLKYKKADRPDMAMVIKLVDSSKKIYSYLQKIDSLSKTEKIAFINNLLNVASSATGLPMYNAWRDFKAVWNTVVSDILDIDYGTLKWQSSEDVKKQGYERVASYLRDGNETRAEYVYMQILSNYGDDAKEVKKTFEGVRSAIESAYDQANPTEQDLDTLERFYKLFGVEDAEGEADFRIAWREYAKNNPDSPLTNQAAYQTYYDEIAPSGIDIETYVQYYPYRDKSQAEQLPIIDALPITDEQKDFLYLRKWSESTLESKAPWRQ